MKTTEVGGEERGYDAGKKISGRKRHIAVDTLGLLLVVVVAAWFSGVQEGGRYLLRNLVPPFTVVILSLLTLVRGAVASAADWVARAKTDVLNRSH